MRYKCRTRLLVFILGIVATAVFYSAPSWHQLTFWKRSLCSCSKCLREGDSCFAELVNSSPPPFLSRNNTTPEEIFNWWRRIQGSRHNFTVYNEMLDTAFKMFPHFPRIPEARPDRCRSCAVVGNSGNLKGSRYGSLIDFHNIVIRMNHGRTKGYEEDVGTKTTYHIMYPESAEYLANTTFFVFFPYKTQDFPWLFKKFNPEQTGPVKPRMIGNKDLMMMLNPTFMKHVHEEWLANRGAYPSTGFIALILSLQLCDEVSVFGYGADRDGNWNHYFEVLRNKQLRTGGHPGMHEYHIIQKLHKRNKIQFFKGV